MGETKGRAVRKEVIGNATLYLGDCLEILPTLAAESVDMVWTDPPYGHGNADGDMLSRRAEAVGDGYATQLEAIANDGGEDMRRVVDGALSEAARLLKKDCCCCCCCGGGGPSPTFAWVAERMDRGGLQFFHSVIWDKKNPGMGWRYRRQHEMVMVAHRKGGKLAWADENIKQPNIISLSKPKEGEHPNEKPVALVERFIGLHTLRGHVVMDPFMGSGTTGVAAHRLERKFIGIEIEPRYFAIACERIENAQRQERLFA
ncbi:MAG: site-specific DNA-methyltransferase [Sulfuricaulis sp.]|nr:site-specific DNA-methyltransferase [Sulfuricaulis sp.]